jgi:hypothetical protein
VEALGVYATMNDVIWSRGGVGGGEGRGGGAGWESSTRRSIVAVFGVARGTVVVGRKDLMVEWRSGGVLSCGSCVGGRGGEKFRGSRTGFQEATVGMWAPGLWAL